MEQVALHYWGEPKSRRGHLLRWGNKGSKEVNLKKGTFYDFEEDLGGGVVDLVRLNEGAQLASLPQLLERKFGISRNMERDLRPREFLSKVFHYYDENGELCYQVLRYEPRRFIQRRPEGDEWVYKMDGVQPLPYRLPELLANPDAVVFIAEGEKCVEALRAHGFVATCNHGGAKKWRDPLNKWFRGRKVVLLPDNDQPGIDHMRLVAGSLADIADEMRWVDLPGLPPKGDIADWLLEHDVSELRDLVRNAKPYQPEGELEIVDEPDDDDDTFPIYDLDHLRRMPPVEWVVEGLLTRHGFSVLYGEPGAGKSFVALDIALSIVHGIAWQDHPVQRGAVLYIAGEGVGGLGKRIKGWEAAHGLSGRGAPFFVIPVAVKFREQEDIERLLKTIEKLDARFSMVVVDTVARALLGGDENSATDMGLFIDACDAVKRHTNCALMAIHHSGKDVARGLRGSTALLGGVDASIRVKQDNGVVSLRTEKQKDAESIADIHLEMVSVALIGDSTIVLGQADGAGAERLTVAQALALQALENLIIDLNEKKVRVQQWHDAHKAKAPDSQAGARRDARDALQKKGYVVIDKGRVWLGDRA
jgi:hypothetical protein